MASLELGVPRWVAAEANGVSRTLFFDWLARGRREQRGDFADFLNGVTRSEARAHLRMLAIVRKAAETKAEHARWWLERRDPEHWGPRPQVEEAEAPQDQRVTSLNMQIITDAIQMAKVMREERERKAASCDRMG